jgi:L-ascorbate peroxidase
VKQVQEIQKTGNHITTLLSTSDLIQLGGYAAVEYCGGPAMIFNMGRKDIGSEGDAVQHSAETHAGSLVVQGLAQSDFSPEEFVALMGSFTIGFCGEDKKGPTTRWNMNPYIFDNAYYKELLLKDQSKYYRTEADLKLVQNAQLKSWVEAYAQDQDLFFRNYAKAHVKLSEIGWEGQLLSEMEPERTIDGGYIEKNRLGAAL